MRPDKLEHEKFAQLASQSFWDKDSAGRFAFATAMAAFLPHEDVGIRFGAIERLTTAVNWETLPRTFTDEERKRHWLEHIPWMLRHVEQAHGKHPDVIPVFLRVLCFKPPGTDAMPIILDWLDELEREPPLGVDPDLAFGVRIMIDGPRAWDCRHGAIDWLAGLNQLTELLDHPSGWVRACAAHRLEADDDVPGSPTSQALFDLISAKEIERPGVAGPFWSQRHEPGLTEAEGRHGALWMMDLLERREGPPAHELPTNDIEFYLHELCSEWPEMVHRMIDGGFLQLAIMTATEAGYPVEGMPTVLLRLAEAPQVAQRARDHHQRIYGARSTMGI